MFDAANARRLMVEGQVRTADVNDTDLLDAMATVPREAFLPPALAPLAYLDNDIQIAKGRALLRPMMLAKLIQAARLNVGDRVLDVACGTGYSSAVLSKLAGSVVALEEDAELARRAKEALAAVGANAVEVAIGPLTAGWAAGGPYDVVLFNGSAEIVPEAFASQLKPDGRLLAVFGRAPATKGVIFHCVEGRLAGRPIFDGAARLLPGFAAPQSFVF
ncbi:MAG: protein-L-isoaspartate O-methyltransferase [Hyphomicrobiales bacterium]|nr:protein-L-isoaspartate O-methyltransferase [Hyphomicrobiales bacterium]MDE2285548.1 protein-L-isoaspartate O-methyltransferase [Hyphomicrobiales bacterium]